MNGRDFGQAVAASISQCARPLVEIKLYVIYEMFAVVRTAEQKPARENKIHVARVSGHILGTFTIRLR